MTEENIAQGSLESKVDLTQSMPPYPEGKAVQGMTPEESQAEWEQMTIGAEKYKNWPRSVFVARRNALWERGFGAKMVEEEKTRQAESKEWLEKENDRIEERDDLERERKAKEIGVKFFGSERKLDQAIEEAVETVHGLSEENKDFLNTEIPNRQFAYGDLPFVISVLAGISQDPDLIESVNQVGLEKLIRLADKSGILGRRK